MGALKFLTISRLVPGFQQISLERIGINTYTLSSFQRGDSKKQFRHTYFAMFLKTFF